MALYQKIFSELRYPGQIDILENLAGIVKLYYPEKLKHWTIENNMIVRLHDNTPFTKSQESLMIDHKRFIYSYENPSTDNFFEDKMNSFHSRILKVVSIEQYARIGIRAYVKYGYIKLDDFITKSKDNMIFSKQFTELIDNDFTFTDLSLTIQNESNRINIGPMKKDEQNNYTQEFVVNDNMNDDYILLDIDCFQVDVKSKEYPSVYKKLYNRMLSIRDNMIKYFSGVCHE